MAWRRVQVVLLVCVGSGAPVAALAQSDVSFASLSTPTTGPSRVIGSYTAGCITGAVPLPFEGPGYEAIRVSRNRYWGHDSAIRFIQGYAKRSQASGLPTLYIGDISQPRGGRMGFGHASHQVGLDVDIWFELGAKPRMPAPAREEPVLRSLVSPGDGGIDESVWQPGHVRLLRHASETPTVDRIFVNKWIKRRLCDTAGTDRAWLRKIVPWFGHDGHFHVRLACPAGSPDCTAQAPVPAGDGCGKALDDWFVPPPPAPAIPPPPDKPRPPRYPAACQAVLNAP
ncbi:MAG TPA: penicillin-insensitive murein endopeptidase [Vineibacter sp.]|nr:penicillin-insensitive murein endopeptidase [Vineibacter sp.]